MKPEEAIKYLRDPIGKSLEQHDKAVKMAIEALEKQVPKKPIEGATFKHIGKCPDCRQTISTRSAFRNCQYCGQKIDWGNEE